MSIRTRSLILFSLTIVCVLSIVYFISRLILINSFGTLEQNSMQRDIDRVLNDLSRDIVYLEATATDWAVWDDTYQYIQDRNPEYASSNLLDDAFINLDLNLVLMIDSAGEIVFKKTYDLDSEEEIPTSPDVLAYFYPGSPLLRHLTPDSPHNGLIKFSNTPLIFSSHPIVTSDNNGPVRGSLVFGRFLNTQRVERISEKLRLSIDILPTSDPQLEEFIPDGWNFATPLISPVDSRTIGGYAALKDFYGEQAFILRIEQPREIYRQGLITSWFVTISVIGAILACGFLLYFILERLVIRRIGSLNSSVSRIGKGSDRAARLHVSGNDEISSLASSINTMLGTLDVFAVENAELFDRAERKAREAETLRQAGAIVAASLDQDQAIEHILEQLERVVPYDSASVQLLQDGFLVIVGGRGWPDNRQVIGLSFPIPGDNPNTVVIESLKPYVLNDAPTAYALFQEGTHSHIRSWMGIPLIIHDQVIGMLAVDKSQPEFFNDKHVELASAFAGQVAVSIENARLYSDLQRRIGELDALRATVADITAELELQKLLQSMLKRATKLLGATGGDLGLYDEASETIRVVVCHNMGKEYSGTRMVLGEGVMGKVAVTHEPLIVDDYLRWEGRSIQFTDVKWHAVNAAPLLIGKRLVGVIAVVDQNPGHKFDSSDQNLLAMFAQHAAIAVENARLYEEAHHQAITDSLTGLYNRRGLFEIGQREVSRMHRSGQHMSAIMLDIDHFKNVNDRYSHAIGDQVLSEIAARFKASLREIDLLGRYGGEEFAILLPETGVQEANKIAHRLRASISDRPILTEKGAIPITVSLGVTCARNGNANPTTTDEFDEPSKSFDGSSNEPAHINELAVMLDRADTAMYRAKQLGRNQIAVL